MKRLLDQLVIWFRDKRRGYTDKDISSLKRKYKEYSPVPGGVIKVTRAELRAMYSEGISYANVASEIDVLSTIFAKNCAESREKLAKKLINAGYNPDNITIGERIWFDEDTNCMRHECFIASKNVNI